jgi:hypothetical protein
MAAFWFADNARAFWRRYVLRALRAAVIGFVLAVMLALVLLILLSALIAGWARRLFRRQRR